MATEMEKRRTKMPTEEKRVRIQALVPVDKQRRYKSAAALAGVTLEQWIAAACDEKLDRK